ncbi:hypothetical protein CQW23_12198 [Capsicum baccatum]|uniref:Uncharacterized protein n=1 Tax=Capsicum baccatum TaxID=33114 RepID=A0A2G2WS34_CAPBA|nr:hypothetical protein CQW23_12198 [Capsicum baccatum]
MDCYHSHMRIRNASNNDDDLKDNEIPLERIGDHEIPDDDDLKETDVFEVPLKKVVLKPPLNIEISRPSTKDDLKSASLFPTEPVKPSFEVLNLKDKEISLLKSKFEEKKKELKVFRQENEILKKKLSEMMLEISSAKAKEEETSLKLIQVTQELETSKNDGVNSKEKIEATEKAKEALKTEMKKLRVQIE